MKLPALIAAPLAWIYGLIINVRHKLFDLKILRSEEFDIPVVCVGNLTVGGTGKTPVTEFLIERLSGERRVAVLSRGYRRRTKGFVLSTPRSSVKSIGDEPKQMKMKYPDVPMAVCEKRAEGIRRLREIHPEIELVILDDAFQHRYVEPWVNILLMDYNRPVYRLLPWGRLRDTRGQIDRANFVLVTKCPEDLNPLDMRIVRNSLGLYPYQSLYFSRMEQGEALPLFAERTVRCRRYADFQRSSYLSRERHPENGAIARYVRGCRDRHHREGCGQADQPQPHTRDGAAQVVLRARASFIRGGFRSRVPPSNRAIC